MRILLVEDDESMVALLQIALANQNYVVDVATDGNIGWELIQSLSYDLVLLDVMLPGLDGISFCRRIREQRSAVPVLLLTARDSTSDKLLGLDSGADDYVVKPFDLQELLARIRALARRSHRDVSPILSCGQLQLDLGIREVTYAGQPIPLSRKEYLLLELFLRNQHRVFSRAEIVDQLWSLGEDPPNEDTIKSHVKSIRRKLEQVGIADLLETLYGQGYRINPRYLTAAPTDQPEQDSQVEATIAAIWQRIKGVIQQRLQVLEQVVQQLEAGQLDESLRQEGLRNAHKLAGSLGTFGYAASSDLAFLIEHLLQRPLYEPADIQQIKTLVTQLQESLVQGEQSKENPPLPDEKFSVAIESHPEQFQERDRWTRELQRSSKGLANVSTPAVLEALQAISAIHFTCLTQTDLFWSHLYSFQPDLLILEASVANPLGLELLQDVRTNLQWNWLPTILLTPESDRELSYQAFALGVDDWLPLPITAEELQLRVLNRLQRSFTLRHHAGTDFLTELPSRQQALPLLNQQLQLAHQSQHPVSLVIINLDHLSEINNRLGYHQGDQLLSQFSQFLRQKFRTEDLVCRWSGEEFLVGMYGSYCEDAVERIAQLLEAWQLQQKVDRREPWFWIDDQPVTIGFSAGVAQYPIDGITLPLLYGAADTALYQAKRMGRNRVLSTRWRSPEQLHPPSLDVLLIHPEDEFAEQIQKGLEIRGYHTQWLTSGRSAIKELKKKHPERLVKVIVITETLLDLDGLVLLKQLGKQRLKQSHTIFLSSQPETRAIVQPLGISDCLTLPCSPGAIIQQLRQTLSAQRQ